MREDQIKEEPVTEEDLNNLLVPVEPYLENRIQEFGANGEEHFVQNASIGEKLLGLAGKIDYKFVISDKKADEGPKQHPWSDVLKNLNNSYDEVCVLSDLMALLQQRQYLMLDPVQQTKPAYNTSLVIVSKKQGLRTASQILKTGVENMKQGDAGRFHRALSDLNARFKIKKQGNYILGDATYKSCGSKYFDEGLFEVMRNDEVGGSPLKLELDPSVRMVSHVAVSFEKEPHRRALHTPAYWAHLPFPHRQLLGVLHTLFYKEMYYLLSLDCMTITQFRGLMCKAVENEIVIKLGEGRKLNITKYIEPPLRHDDVISSVPLNIHELCLQHHLHKGHKLAYEEDQLSESSQYSTMMLGIVNNKPRQHLLLDFEILHAQHKLKHRQILQRLDKLATSVCDPNITVHLGPCSTAHESSINIILKPSSHIITATRVALRITIGSKNVLQLDSSHDGPVYNGPDVDLLIASVERQVRSQMLYMLISTCTHNYWHILSTETYLNKDFLHVQCPNKQHNLTISIDNALNITCTFAESTLAWHSLPGRNVVHKLTLVLNVICEPVRLSRV